MTIEGTPMSALHHVTVTSPGSEAAAVAVFECHGDATALCHQYPDCQCESWDDNHEHPKVTHEKCWLQDWFEAPAVAYEGEDRDDCNESGLPAGMNRSGDIRHAYEDEYVSWSFMDDGDTE